MALPLTAAAHVGARDASPRRRSSVRSGWVVLAAAAALGAAALSAGPSTPCVEVDGRLAAPFETGRRGDPGLPVGVMGPATRVADDLVAIAPNTATKVLVGLHDGERSATAVAITDAASGDVVPGAIRTQQVVRSSTLDARALHAIVELPRTGCYVLDVQTGAEPVQLPLAVRP